MPSTKISSPRKNLPIGRGKIGFKVSNDYNVSAAKLWEAITQAKHTQKFFVEKVEGDFTTKGEPVWWSWKQYGRFALTPTVVQTEKKLEFQWQDHTGSYQTTVTFSLSKKGKRVQLEIHERGWKQAHLKNAFDNCEGWTTYLCYLKAYVQNGVVLRTKTRN